MENRGTAKGSSTQSAITPPQGRGVIFTYSLEHLLKKDKVRFFYAMKGRNAKPGMIIEYNAHQIGRSVLFVPEDYVDHVEDFFKRWGCNYTKHRVVMRE